MAAKRERYDDRAASAAEAIKKWQETQGVQKTKNNVDISVLSLERVQYDVKMGSNSHNFQDTLYIHIGCFRLLLERERRGDEVFALH
jgi:hypothetical protein